MPAQAQDGPNNVGQALRELGNQYADAYVQPVTDALGADLNAGLFHTADVSGGVLPGIDLYAGVSVMGALTAGSPGSFRLDRDRIRTDDGRTLVVEYPDRDLPTAFGDSELDPGSAEVFDEESGRKLGEITLPSSLIDTPVAPLVVPQIGVGSVFGTDAQVRYLPETGISDYGSVSVVGVAVRHSLSQYIPLSPANVAVQGAWHQISLSDETEEVVDASGWAVNAQVSKSIPLTPITLYGGLQYEQFSVDVGYTFEVMTSEGPATARITLDQDAANQFRALAGVSLTLAVVRINVDYALSANDTVTAGLGVRF